MTIRFRLDALTLGTTEGEVDYRFTSDLTVLAGPTGVGKTTLLELIKFGFGGDARLATVAKEHVDAVTVEVSIGDERLRITRSLDQAKRKTVRVTDLITQERLRDHNIGDEQPSLNTLLLRCLGLPDDMRAAAGGNSTREGNRITFADVFTYLYIPQYEINRDIAHSQDSYREPKRRAVFELLFGLTDSDILAMRSRVNKLKGEIDDAEKEHRTVVEFLRASGTTGRAEAAQILKRAYQNQHSAERELTALREAIEPVADRETQVVRDLLTEAERNLADTRAAEVDLTRRRAEYTAERRRVQADLDRLGRMREAGERLADIEFTVCPRCMQSLARAHTPTDACRLCLQPDPIASTEELDQYEVRQLTSQLAEMEDQLDALAAQQDALTRAITDREQLVGHLTRTLEMRTAKRITPRLQAFSDASERLATAKAQQGHLEGTLRQWDQVSDLENFADALHAEREQLKGQLKRAIEQLDERRADIVDEISEEFKGIVEAIGIPGVQTASVHRDKYLPILNGKIFSQEVLGGGVTTATQVAYWSSLVAVALRRHDTNYPAFLLLDSPRLALNTATNLTAALYRRLVTQADANSGRVQIIIADNELPPTYRGRYAQVDFDYPTPTVATIDHPGLTAVVTIGEPADD
jgi:hypothetical protein